MATEKTDKPDLEPQTRRDALQLLRSPDFFGLLLKVLRKLGLAGEKLNALVLYIVAISSLLDRPLNAMIKGPPSSGKNFLASRVLRLLPETAVREISSNSKTAWNYGQNDFKNRVVYFQERSDDAETVHPLRLLISDRRLVRIVTTNKGGTLTTKKYVTEGPIASISTTTKNLIEIDDETRHVSLWVDVSEEQTQRVINQSLSRESPLPDAELKAWREAYRLIAERSGTPIAIPAWFRIIAKRAYSGNVSIRRYFPAFVEACRTICLLRSFQSDRSNSPGPDRIEVGFEDFAIAAILFEDVFVGSLNQVANNDLSTRVAVEKISEANGGRPVTATELSEYLGITKDRAYQRLRKSSESGAVRRVNPPEQGNAKLFSPLLCPDLFQIQPMF